MKLGVLLGYSGKKISIPIKLLKHAEELGFESAWTAEAYGSDAVTPAAWMLAHTEKIKVGTAIMQAPARSPACAAMTAMTLNQLSGGRFIMGLGPSGPQVVEGWHAASYARPLSRMREYIEITRKIMAREEPVTHDGYHYQMPYQGDGATGSGQAAQDHPSGRQLRFRSIPPPSPPAAFGLRPSLRTVSSRCG